MMTDIPFLPSSVIYLFYHDAPVLRNIAQYTIITFSDINAGIRMRFSEMNRKNSGGDRAARKEMRRAAERFRKRIGDLRQRINLANRI